MVAGYARATATLIPTYDAIDPAALYAPVRPVFPKPPARVLDVGAGTGRDALWFARQGFDVTAVEPVDALNVHARTTGKSIEWRNACLPDLQGLQGQHDLIILSAVWHHVHPEDRARALGRLADLLAPGGVLVMSLRMGACNPDRPGFDVDPVRHPLPLPDTLRSVAPLRAASQQSANRNGGVSWIWLICHKVGN
ncbi:bifunctional 2-polyprenyl-6-hydroxyphenol methylase/3-demethylubiquinol 3-O-methyltransferase UbiG [Sulfitobacter sp. S190]|uniref:class I SAM-dependent methyltransferase n=1 Tax=Sulfitobacter sp. S190 TaxID=2867022 RepID=UPI0021A7E28A|nr:class I SAM-dependent methyltransferase [Sulfitobacter sp. S190]UWR22767.1 class I SAM-dependent methyltransferase [Sulfitobacter sp. S190]